MTGTATATHPPTPQQRWRAWHDRLLASALVELEDWSPVVRGPRLGRCPPLSGTILRALPLIEDPIRVRRGERKTIALQERHKVARTPLSLRGFIHLG